MALDSDEKKSLRLKVEEADLALSFKKRAVNDAIWAEAQVELSEALLALADAEENDEQALSHYEEAAISYENALQVFTKERNFSRWGGVIVSYVRCLRNYSLRENGPIATLRLNRALKLLFEIFEALPLNQGAFDRALLYAEQGHIYRALANVGLLRERLDNLEKAIHVFKYAVDILREKENFYYWSQALTSYAVSCFEAAKMQTPIEAGSYIEKAIIAFETLLSYYDKDKNPDDWYYIQFEFGRALLQKSFYSEHGKIKILEQALAAFQQAKASLKNNNEAAFIRLHNEMAMTFSLIAQQANISNPEYYLLQSVALYQTNLKLLKNDVDKVSLAIIYGNYGKDLTQLANLSTVISESLEYRYQAIKSLRKAVCQELRHSRFSDWFSYFVELGAALQSAANLETEEKQTQLFEEAIDIYTETIDLIQDKPQSYDLYLRLLQWRGMARAHLGENKLDSKGLALLQQAEKDLRQTIALSQGRCSRIENIHLNINLSYLLYTIARRPDSKEPLILLDKSLEAIENSLAILETEQSEAGQKIKAYDEEKNSALAHKAVILWRLGSYGKKVDNFSKAQDIFKDLLQSPNLQENTNIYNRIKSNFALMLRDWALQAKPAKGVQYLDKSYEMLQSIRIHAENSKENTMLAQIDDDLSQIAQQKKALAKKRFWTFWPF